MPTSILQAVKLTRFALLSIPLSSHNVGSIIFGGILLAVTPLMVNAAPQRGVSFPPNAQAIEALIDSTVNPLMNEYGIPGIAIGVSINGQQYFFSYGVSSKKTGEKVNENTLFEIGSFS